MPASAAVESRESPLWIRDKRFDLLFLTLSGALVFFPYLTYGLLQSLGVSEATSSLIAGLSVTVLVGGPHMYSTYLRTAFERRFRSRHGLIAYLPLLVIPTLVVLGAIHNFILLLTGFFLWASLHVTHQAQYISETYRMRAGAPTRSIDRWLDGGVILGVLYMMAMWHSLQYFALTWFILGREAAEGRISNRFVATIASGTTPARFYGAMIGATASAGVIYQFLWKALHFS
jgi:hypothetical protein